MSYLGRLQNSLKEKDLDRYIQYNPSTKNVRKHPDMHGPGDPRSYKQKRADAGTIDFYHYGGKKSKETEWEELVTGKLKGKDKNDQTRKDWQKVAKELGINQVDSEKEVRRMIDHVMGNRAVAEEQPSAPPPPPVESNTERPDEVKQDQRRFEETRLDRPENQMPRLEDAFRSTSDANMGAIRGGDHLNKWYQTKFVPHLEADANATMSEQGDDARDLMKSFAFNPPKLGSVKELFDKYKGEIEDLD